MSSRFASFALQCSMAAMAIGGCGNSGGGVCTSDDQCASHFCRADGTCGPAEIDANSGSDGSGSGSGDAGTMGLCAPNHDGTIAANEVPLAAGKMANYRIATSATWNTTGTASGSTRTWDLTGALSNDTDTPVTLQAPAGAWWAGDSGFASATYWTQLEAGQDFIGVFHVDATGVTLLGIVSSSGSYPYTELTYDPPARILAVPYKAADTWTSSSTVSGYLNGTVANYTEKYVSNVDQTGTMKTPYGDFPVLRIGTVLTDLQLGTPYKTVRSYAWTAECFGTVASATSTDNETNAEFSNDAEVRRIIP